MSVLSDELVAPRDVPTPQPALRAIAVERSWRRFALQRWHVGVLLGILSLGTLLRFCNLTNPALWGDEGYTFHRTAADYRDLLDRLQYDGFTPMHYQLYWWVGKGLPLWDGEHSLFCRHGDGSYGFTPLGRWLVLGGAGLLVVLASLVVASRWPGEETLLTAGVLAGTFVLMVTFYWWRDGVAVWTYDSVVAHAVRLLPLAAVGTVIALLHPLARIVLGRRARWVTLGLIGGVLLVGLVCAVRFGLPNWALEERAIGELPLGPIMMRAFPAAAGALMVATIYFLARQVAGTKVSLVAALLAACSAYLLVYSRDAKMYMPCWFFVTLHVGCLLWWQRTGLRIAWLAWIAAGVAAVGWHVSAAAVILPQIVILLTPPRFHWKQLVLGVIGLAIVSAGPIGYYVPGAFNKWNEKTGGLVPEKKDAEDRTNFETWDASGINWVEDYQEGRTGPDLVLHTATAFLYSWEWPKDEQLTEIEQSTGRPVIPPWIVSAGIAAFVLILSLMALGALPWGRRLRPKADADAQPWWRQALWLGAWLIVPTYGFFYCRSVADFASPVEWLVPIRALWEGYWLWLLPGLGLVGAVVVWTRPNRAVFAAVIALAVGALFLVFWLTEPMPRGLAGRMGMTLDGTRVAFVASGSPADKAGLVAGDRLLEINGQRALGQEDIATASHRAAAGASISLKIERTTGLQTQTRTVQARLAGAIVNEPSLELYLQTVRGQVMRWVLAAMLIVLVPLCWYFAGPTMALRWKKTGQLALVAGGLFGVCMIGYAFWSGVKNDFRLKIVRDTLASPAAGPGAVRGLIHSAADGQLALRYCNGGEDEMSLKITPATAVMVNGAPAGAEALRPDMLALVAIQDGAAVRVETRNEPDWQSQWAQKVKPMWMPRYLGVLWPAVGIAAAALLMRLPTWPLRALAIALLVGVNLANGLQRILGQSEPPLDRFAHDFWEAADPASKTEAYTSFTAGGAHPGDAGPLTAMGRYYFCHEANIRPTYLEFRGQAMFDELRQIRPGLKLARDMQPATIRRDVEASGATRVIVWQRYGLAGGRRFEPRYPLPPPDMPPEHQDEILAALGPGWTRASAEDIAVRQHWSWRDRGICRRREYVKRP